MSASENNVTNTNVIITTSMLKLEPGVHTPENHHHQLPLQPRPPYDCGGAAGIANVSDHKRQRHRSVKQEVARISGDEQYNDQIDEADVEFFNSFPPGYRFCPTDEELIEHYLFKKLKNVELPRNQIREVNIYRFNPDEIAERYPSINKNAWYFFTPRDKKYLHGRRPNRAAGAGFWKACGADKVIHDKNRPAIRIGLKKALVYHRGKPPKGQKTNWLMHEFMLHEAHPQFSEIKTDTDRPADSMKLNDFVLCKIYKRNDNALRAEKAEAMEDEVKDEAAVMEGEGNVVAEAAVKEEFEGNVKVEEEDNAAAFHLQNDPYPPSYDPSIHYPYEEYYSNYSHEMPSTSYHQNQHYSFHQSGSNLNSQVFMNGFDPSICMEEDVDYFVEEFDDIITP